jgi:S-adenosylmethionine:tRNA-ribosyltransferase-isomerase (queuine synthetase)
LATDCLGSRENPSPERHRRRFVRRSRYVPYSLPAATGPIEATGRRRDDARLLVSSRFDATDTETVFSNLPDFLDPGDVLVVNTSATLPAAIPLASTREGGEGVPDAGRGLSEAGIPPSPDRPGNGAGLLLHLSSELPGGLRLVELRRASGAGTLPFPEAAAGTVELPAGGRATLLAP